VSSVGTGEPLAMVAGPDDRGSEDAEAAVDWLVVCVEGHAYGCGAGRPEDISCLIFAMAGLYTGTIWTRKLSRLSRPPVAPAPLPQLQRLGAFGV
jgi:hypothetical protein